VATNKKLNKMSKLLKVKKKLVVIKPRPKTIQGINITKAIIIGSSIVQQ